MAPILPNIDQESSVENFNKKITENALAMSFEIGDNAENVKLFNFDNEEMLDFDFVEEEFIEAPIYESMVKSFMSNGEKMGQHMYSRQYNELTDGLDIDYMLPEYAPN